MSVTHPSGSDLESMNEFYDKKFLRAVTLLDAPYSSHVKVVLQHVLGRADLQTFVLGYKLVT